MRVALEVWSSRFEQVESTCALAESLGIDAFYYGESPHGLNLDCWTTLAGLARTTERIRLGPVITNVLPTYRSLALLAKQASTVASLSDGRLDFRTGVGAAPAFARSWWEPFGIDYPDYGQRLADLAEALDKLPLLWAGEPLVRRAEQESRDRGQADSAVRSIPVTVAARGTRSMRLAAATADAWETSFCTATEFAAQNAQMTDLLAGREIVRSLEIDGFVSETPRGVDRLLDRIRTERGPAEDLRPVLERALVGVPSDAAGHLVELAGMGVDQVVVALHDPHDPDAVEALAATATMVRDGV